MISALCGAQMRPLEQHSHNQRPSFNNAASPSPLTRTHARVLCILLD